MDIYFREAYGKLNEYIENGTCETFEYRSELGLVRHMFIKRQLPFPVDGEQWYDLITPYGYGGPQVVRAQEGAKEALCEAFGNAFSEYCRDNRIVSEFIRFHPLEGNAADFQALYHPIYMRKTLGTDLESYADPVQSEFSRGCRKSIRQALRKGVEVHVTERPDDLSTFCSIYYDTMRRDGAASFYYFDKSYFDAMLRLIPENLLYIEARYEGTAIAAGLCLLSDRTMHVHLSGTLEDYLHLSPAYVLRYAAVVWGKEHGYRVLHHGGGTSNAEDNPLYLFKRQFARNTDFDFYIGKKIWNQRIYDAAVQQSGLEPGGYFPQYRLP